MSEMTASTGKRTRARRPDDSVEMARTCARLADEKKGEDITILDLRKITYFTDFFVLVTVTNPRQMRAISDSVLEAMSNLGVRPIGIQGTEDSGWVLGDYGDVVVHLFDPRCRRLYDLELLWGDAPRIEWSGATR